MSQQIINIGTSANDGTGDTLRAGGAKINDNFSELYAGKENLSNKSLDGTLSASSDTLYPSQKAVKTYVDSISAVVANEISNFDGWAIETFEDYSLGANPTLNKGVGWDGNGTGSGITVVSRNIANSKTEKRLSISNGQYGRKFYWGDNWIKMQVALLARISASSTFSGDLEFGVCSGTSSMFSSPSCVSWIGGTTLPGNGNQFTLTAGTRLNVFLSTYAGFATKRGSGLSNESSGVGSVGQRLAATGEFRHIIILDITRTAVTSSVTTGSYTLSLKWTEVGSQEFDCGKRQFLKLLDDSQQFGWFTIGASHTFNYDEAVGGLNTFNINWPNITGSLELSTIAARRLQ